MRLRFPARFASSTSAFTLVEMVMAMFSVGVLGIILAVFGFTSSRFVAKNLATNHSMQTARISAMSLLKEARDAAGEFRIATYNGTNFSEISLSYPDLDALTGKKASSRGNAFFFRQQVAGPLKLTANVVSKTNTITLNIPTGSVVPLVNDCVEIPLINETYRISAITGSGTTRTITVSEPIDYTLDVASPNLVTANIYRRVGYSVWQNQLRFHSNLNALPTAGLLTVPGGSYTIVRRDITSPSPFSGLEVAATEGTSIFNLRVSLEITDLGYSSRNLRNGTTTLYTVIPVRNRLAKITEPSL